MLNWQSLGAVERWSVVSPSQQVKLLVEASESGQLYYRIQHGEAGVEVIKRSSLGLRLEGENLSEGLRFVSAQPRKLIEENYTLLHGKRRECLNRATHLTLSFRSQTGLALELDLRAYDNGAAFRYRLPGNGGAVRTLEAEATSFALPVEAKVWCAPSDKPGTYSPAYETYYENEVAAGTRSPSGFGWSFPLLFRTEDSRHWGLITEADVDEHFCGTRLANEAPGGVYSIAWPSAAEGNGTGAQHPASKLPWQMPWRVIVLGDSPAGIVESTLVTDVSAPARIQDAGWVRPGRVAWSWWSDNPSPLDAAKQMQFVDLAAEMGWEYVLVDANWTIMTNGNTHDVLRYAKEKGVGVVLWYNSGGPHNLVTEKPRDCLTYEPVRKFELKLLNEWGVKGIKADFFQSDKQDVIRLYRDILRDAAERKIMVNFHGCTLPRGWERAYPHLMSMEGVRGEECYIFDARYPERAPVQNTILPFARNAVGPMDYTPVTFSNNRYPHKTTYAHELALAVLFESGWVHFADKAEAYLALPPVPKQFLKEIPVAWDDTRLVDGYPGQFAVLARRKGDVWYVGGVNGHDRPRTVKLEPGKWLGNGRHQITLITDGLDARSFDSSTRPLESKENFELKLLPYGGFTAVIKPAS